MFDSRKELLDKIRLGEDSFLEFKEVRFAGGRVSEPRRDSLADELAAFANSHGGVLILACIIHERSIDGCVHPETGLAGRGFRVPDRPH